MLDKKLEYIVKSQEAINECLQKGSIKRVKYKGYDCVEFNIKVTMKDRWVPYFLSMLKRMEYLGGVGSSRLVSIFSDGDGDFRPKFEWESKLLEEPFPPNNDREDHIYDAG